MTAIDINAFDLNNATDRLVLADLLDDVGRTDEAARVRESRYELIEGRFMARLSKEDCREAIQAFAEYMLGEDADPEEVSEYMEECEVLYRDDDTGSFYQVVDAQGRSDGEWTPVEQ